MPRRTCSQSLRGLIYVHYAHYKWLQVGAAHQALRSELRRAERLALDRARQTLHVDFSGLQINSSRTIAAIDAAVRALLQGVTGRVDAVVNYDHFGIAPELVDPYAAMVRALTADHYGRVTRYGTTGFLKSRLAGGAAERDG